jgi:hypothetical protein
MLRLRSWCLAIALYVVVGSDLQAQVIRSASGVNAAAIQATVESFRADLGINNGLGPCAGGCVPGLGRREINWDAVPDSFSSGGANPFPGDFFNLTAGSPAGRVRGAQFSTSGTFEVSADSDSNNDGLPGPELTLFGNRNLDNQMDFEAFSQERIFGLLGTNQMDVTFAMPGQPATAATVRGFGAIFTDVEVVGSTTLDFFDASNNLLTSQVAPRFEPPAPGDSGKSFSFLGVSFANPNVARVRITNGGYDLTVTQQFGLDDAVAMDDFIYGEPFVVPEPGSAFVAASCLLCLVMRRSRSR